MKSGPGSLAAIVRRAQGRRQPCLWSIHCAGTPRVAAFILALAAIPYASAEDAFDISAAAVPATLIEQHILATHATSIALDTEILESQITTFTGLFVYGSDRQCHSLVGGGSLKV